jgi:colanic acid/amylovoran biosynthesis glycosyltransferase
MTQQRRAVGYVVRKFPVLSETFILNEILALEAKGVEVHVFALAPTRDPRFHEGVVRMKAPIHYVPGATELRALLRQARRQAARDPQRYRRELLGVLATGRPKLLWRFLQASWIADRARRAGVRHLHAHFASHPTTVARQASRLLDVPFSFTAHAFDIYRDAKPRVIARKMSDARFTVTVSDYNVDFLRAIVNGSGARIELIRNGIDMARFAPPPAHAAGAFRLLAVARLVEKKGLALLVEACRELRARGLEFRCDIIGKGAQKAALDALIREWDLRAHVRLLGALPQQEIVAHYHAAHALVLPCVVGRDGNRDGLPVSIVEALACGLPVISTPVTGIPEAVRHGENGLIVPSGDAAALADAVALLMRDPALLARLRAGARPSVIHEFDEQRTAARLYALLHEEVA